MRVTLRNKSSMWLGTSVQRLPGSLALGLLAAYAAHAAAYGNGHAMGGSYADMLHGFASIATLGFAGLWFAVSWVNGPRLRNGSVLSAVMTRYTPSWLVVAAAGSGWYCLAESLEHAHAQAPISLVAIALVLASFAARAIARFALRALAGFVFAIGSPAFKRRSPAFVRIADAPLPCSPLVRAWRLFSRPPPTVRRSPN
jgi:hypothetical protein